ADRRRRPEHERHLPVAAVAEPASPYPGELVAAHGAADATIGGHVNGQVSRLHQRHPPGGAAQTAPIAAVAIDVNDEPVAPGLRPADDTTVNRSKDVVGDRCSAR